MRPRLALATLAVVAALALAGCSAAGSLRMDAVDDAELAEKASHSLDDARYYPETAHDRFVRSVIRDGPMNRTTGRDSIRTELPYEYDGRYYNITAQKLGTVPGYSVGVSVDYNDSSPNGTAVAFADLSTVDRRTLRPLLRQDPGYLEDGFELQVPLWYTQAERANSTLARYAGETIALSYRGETYEVSLDPFRETELRKVRYDANLVADSSQDYAAQLKREYAFTLRNLNDNESKIVEKAIEDGYYADSTDDAGFASLVERFRSHRAVESHEYSGSWLVRYKGTLYWAEMDYGAFVDEDGESVTPPSETPH